MIAGIDLSSFAIDIVFLADGEETWARVDLGKAGDAFDRSRGVVAAMHATSVKCEGRSRYLVDLLTVCKAIGIEEPRGMNPGPTFRVQGGALQAIPRSALVQPWVPSQWRKAVGLKGNAKKPEIMEFVKDKLGSLAKDWPQDACDAWCVAEATRLAVSA